jgi:hypothetical protein
MSATKAISEWESVEPYGNSQGWVLVGATVDHRIQYADAEAAARYINHLRNLLENAYKTIKEYMDAEAIVSDIIDSTTGGASDGCE